MGPFRSRIVSAPAGHPVAAFKATCRMAAAAIFTGPLLDGPISVTVVCVFPRTKDKIYKKQAMPRLPHCVRPDCDNVAKSVLDALTGIVWRDDKQIYELRVLKQVAAGDEQPHCEVRVRTQG